MIDFAVPTLRHLYCKLPSVKCSRPQMSRVPRTCLGVLLENMMHPVTYLSSNLFSTVVSVKGFIKKLFCKLLVGKPCNHPVIPVEPHQGPVEDYSIYIFYLNFIIFFGGLVALAAVISKIVKSNKRKARSKFTKAGSSIANGIHGQNLIKSTNVDNFLQQSLLKENKKSD